MESSQSSPSRMRAYACAMLIWPGSDALDLGARQYDAGFEPFEELVLEARAPVVDARRGWRRTWQGSVYSPLSV